MTHHFKTLFSLCLLSLGFNSTALGEIIEGTDANFQQQVLKSSKPAVLFFWAEWCGPCQTIEPVFQELATKNANKVTFVKINVDENAQLPKKYNIRAIPTFIFLKNGKTPSEISGAQSKAIIQSKIDNILLE